MEWHKLGRFCWDDGVITLYTNRFIPANAAGCARGPFIFIRPEYKNDKGLLAHEKVHVWQWTIVSYIAVCMLAVGGFLLSEHVNFPAWIVAPLGLAAHGLLYRLLPEYRLDCEVEAYKEQLRHDPQHLDLYAYFIATKYDLKISKGEVITLLNQRN